MKELLKTGMVIEWKESENYSEYGITIVGNSERESFILFKGLRGLRFDYFYGSHEPYITKIFEHKDKTPHYTICNATEILKGKIDLSKYNIIYQKEENIEPINFTINLMIDNTKNISEVIAEALKSIEKQINISR